MFADRYSAGRELDILPKRTRVNDYAKMDRMRELPPSSGCFACGLDNPSGLGIRFYTDGKAAYGEYVPTTNYQGYAGVLHGGILTTLLDEAMVKALAVEGIIAVTGKIEVRFRRPAPTGERLLVRGWVKSQRAGGFLAEGEIIDSDGMLLAEAEGLLFSEESRSV